MRIEGYIDHSEIKITVMKMNNRFTVKFEKLGLEQSFKFNESDYIKGLIDIKKIIDSTFIDEVQSLFTEMRKLRFTSLDKIIADGGDSFPNII